ncbi:hypothetical protein ACVGVM_14195 [Pseudonocardia bannensis]|uniref:Uncharacterized protein n=1 Tax=Pseudonocardia bannensis TaxID=630973 RepID=A0A848DE58_9PSEU|nr:hypothetical protein [Pseudonocardia bannensis]NMH90847.1 hypothetical protein [Pseudonocardia bannensis]
MRRIGLGAGPPYGRLRGARRMAPIALATLLLLVLAALPPARISDPVPTTTATAPAEREPTPFAGVATPVRTLATALGERSKLRSVPSPEPRAVVLLPLLVVLAVAAVPACLVPLGVVAVARPGHRGSFRGTARRGRAPPVAAGF